MNELIQIGAVSPLRQRLIDDMEMVPLALTLPKSGRHNTNIRPSAFERPLSLPKTSRSVLSCGSFWEATAGPTTCSKPLSS